MGLLSVPKHYTPRKGAPRESLLYVSAAERKMIKAMTDGKLSRTKHGIMSAYMEGTGGASGIGNNRDANGGGASSGGGKMGSGSSQTGGGGPKGTGGASSGAGNGNAGGGSNSGSSRDDGMRDSVGANSGLNSGGGGSGGSYNGGSTTQVRSGNGKMGSGSSQAGMGFNAATVGRTLGGLLGGGGISTPNAAGSPGNNPTKINITPGDGSLRNAMTQREAVNQMAPQAMTDPYGGMGKMGLMSGQTSPYNQPVGAVTDPYGGMGKMGLQSGQTSPYSAPEFKSALGYQAPAPFRAGATPGVPEGYAAKYFADRYGDVEDLTRPDLANPDLNTGDWSYNPDTGVRTPVYNAVPEGAVPSPRISPLKQSPVMRTPRGDVDLWSPTDTFKAPTTAAGQAMMRNMQLAAFNTGTLVSPFSGVAGRKSGTKNHPSGNAIDVNIIDPKTGKALGNFQNPKTFRDYESYAMGVRKQQEAMNPELNDSLRWGGYFSNRGSIKGGTAVDQMHFDVSPQFGGQMRLGSWDNGATPQLAAAYPGYGANQPPSAYEVAMNNVPSQPSGPTQTASIGPAVAPPSPQQAPAVSDVPTGSWMDALPGADYAKQAINYVDEKLVQPTKEQIDKYGGFENAGRLSKIAVSVMKFMPGGDGLANTRNNGEGGSDKDGWGSNYRTASQPAAPSPGPVAPPVNPMQPWLYPQYTQSWAGLPTGIGGYTRA